MNKKAKAVKGKRKKKESGNFLIRMIEKKQYLEFFTALLTIPFLVTVLILNLNALNNLNKPKEEEKPNVFEKTFFTKPTTGIEPSESLNPKESIAPCKEQIGPIEIASPRENETVTDNPIFVEVDYSDDTYCPAVWSYRINGKSWSAYGDSNIALYNLSQGNTKIELRVKSLSGGQEKTITRNFVYKGTNIVAPPDDASNSASTQ